jgi:Bacterial PH domain
VRRFDVAPWPGWLKVISLVSSLILIGVAYGVAKLMPSAIGVATACLTIAVLVGSALSVVRGYELDRDRLSIQRLLWSTVVDIRGLTRVWHDPKGLRGSIRVFGNGGLFSLTGIYWSRALGRYRMFATDPKQFVGMVLPGRKIVVTPADPEAFVQEIRTLYPNAD